jgi:hypothetical protein
MAATTPNTCKGDQESGVFDLSTLASSVRQRLVGRLQRRLAKRCWSPVTAKGWLPDVGQTLSDGLSTRSARRAGDDPSLRRGRLVLSVPTLVQGVWVTGWWPSPDGDPSTIRWRLSGFLNTQPPIEGGLLASEIRIGAVMGRFGRLWATSPCQPHEAVLPGA